MATADEIRAEMARRQGGSASATTRDDLRAELARRNPSSERELIGTSNSGARLYRNTDGTQSYVSDGYSTSDPAAIETLMNGGTPADVIAAQPDVADERAINDFGRVNTRVLKTAEGLPFIGSYADEAIGLVGGEGARDAARAASDGYERQNPGRSTALQVGGTLAGVVPALAYTGPALLAQGGTRLAKAGWGALGGLTLGGAEGAIYGAGEGETGEERAANAQSGALWGAGIGGLTGGVAPHLADGAGWVMQKGAEIFGATPTARIARELGVSRDAAERIQAAAARGDMDAAQDALRRAGSDAMLADALPEFRTMLDASVQTTSNAAGIATPAIQARTNSATGRMNTALDDALGPIPDGQQSMIDAIRTNSAPARSQAYDAAYATPIDYSGTNGRRIEAMLGRVPQRAIDEANRLMKINGEESAQIMARVADDGSVSFQTMPDVLQLDYITRALDDMAETANAQGGALGGQTRLGSSLGGLRRQIRDVIKDEVPAYAEALEVASEAIGQRRAADMGYSLLGNGTRQEDVAAFVADASEAQMGALRAGIRGQVDEITSRVQRTVTDDDTTAREGIAMLRTFSSRANQAKLRTVLGQDAADALMEQVDQAATAFEIRAAVAQNSRTAVRQDFQSGVQAASRSGLVHTLASGEPINATKRIVQVLSGHTEEASLARDAQIFEEIADILTRTDGVEAERALAVINSPNAEGLLPPMAARFVAETLLDSSVLQISREGAQETSTQAR